MASAQLNWSSFKELARGAARFVKNRPLASSLWRFNPMRLRTIAWSEHSRTALRRSGPVVNCGHAFFMRAVGTTINIAARLDTVANDSAATVFAFGSERMNGAFKTIKVALD